MVVICLLLFVVVRCCCLSFVLSVVVCRSLLLFGARSLCPLLFGVYCRSCVVFVVVVLIDVLLLLCLLLVVCCLLFDGCWLTIVACCWLGVCRRSFFVARCRLLLFVVDAR